MPTIRVRSSDVESKNYIGTNSSVFVNGDFVSLTSGFAVKSTAGKRIIGIANSSKTFASNNQTVAQAKLNVTRVEPAETLVQITTSASIAAGDVGKFYDLVTGTQLVDVATALISETGLFVKTDDAGVAVDAVVPRQLKLETFVSSTSGIFSFV